MTWYGINPQERSVEFRHPVNVSSHQWLLLLCANEIERTFTWQ